VVSANFYIKCLYSGRGEDGIAETTGQTMVVERERNVT
jgi:hypothetical protein